MDIANADGGLLYKHELTETTSLPFERVVPAGASVEIVVPAPSVLPTGATNYQAVLYYRNVRTQYYRAATGDSAGSAPTVQLASVTVTR
jgi:hypothetical protein